MKKNLLLFFSVCEDIEIKHFIRIMRLSIFLVLVAVFCSHATTSSSQNIRVTISEKTLSLDKLINEIEKQTNYLFIYGENDIDLSQVVKVNAKNKPISEILDNTLESLGITYEFANNYISLRKVTNSVGKVEPQKGKKVSGVIVDSKGEPIIGANILIKGMSVGTTTDLDGNFSLEASANSVLQISYIGYTSHRFGVPAYQS